MKLIPLWVIKENPSALAEGFIFLGLVMDYLAEIRIQNIKTLFRLSDLLTSIEALLFPSMLEPAAL